MTACQADLSNSNRSSAAAFVERHRPLVETVLGYELVREQPARLHFRLARSDELEVEELG